MLECLSKLRTGKFRIYSRLCEYDCDGGPNLNFALPRYNRDPVDNRENLGQLEVMDKR